MQPHISLLWVQADTIFMVQLEVLLYKTIYYTTADYSSVTP